MIIVKQAHEADICVSASNSGFWVRGNAGKHNVDMHFSQVLSVKYYLRNLEKYLFSTGHTISIKVFDMTERCSGF